MTKNEVNEVRRFADRFLKVVGDLERERDEWRHRFECLAYEVEDLMEASRGVAGPLSEVAPWKAVFESGLLPTMVGYIKELRRQRELQCGGVDE